MSEPAQGLPALDRIEEDWLDPALIEAVPVDWVRRHALVPFRRNGQIGIAGADVATLQAYEDLALLLGAEAAWFVAPAAEIQRAIDRCYYRRAGQADAAAAQAGQAAAEEGAAAPARREADDLLAGSADAPVAHYVNAILLEAVKRGASDIHIEPFADALAVRYRIDGLLYEQPRPPRHLENALTARLKVMAKLDLAEKRLPQDGVARVRVGAREIDVRVSSVPVAEGERIVLRLLHRESTRYSLNELGMAPGLLEQVQGLTPERLVNAYAAALHEITQRYMNISFLFVPHDIRGRVSDVMLAEAIYAAVPAEVRAHCMIIPTPCKPAEIKAMVAGLDFVLSGKMHLAIAALGQGVPVACIAYQDKFEGLFQHFELEGLTIQPEDVIMPGKLSAFFIEKYEQREALAEQVRRHLPAVRDLARVSLG